MVSNMENEFKHRLKELRKQKNMSQDQLSGALDIPSSSLRRYETRGELPKRERLELIADYFSVSIDYLLGRTDNPEQVLSEPSRALIDSLDLTDEEIMSKMDFIVDGIKLNDDDVRRFIALVRAERSMKKQVSAVQGVEGDKL
ncbi:helix-turn-helix transcriptional regulator [Paenibacillus sp. FSL R10-2791]|uniref:helix-turn-helix domain-containing protein n=1 Tax=Paenibacillus sp. FSL R10-2791 TaxID=2954695 RepID=UPI0030F500C0